MSLLNVSLKGQRLEGSLGWVCSTSGLSPSVPETLDSHPSSFSALMQRGIFKQALYIKRSAGGGHWAGSVAQDNEDSRNNKKRAQTHSSFFFFFSVARYTHKQKYTLPLTNYKVPKYQQAWVWKVSAIQQFIIPEFKCHIVSNKEKVWFSLNNVDFGRNSLKSKMCWEKAQQQKLLNN